ncbi:MAG: choice-of-anchor B family protein [Gemmatimonadetes bacterium]|nr:choice-of-anchor B family protein [Gemmatimonadota bacterium]
MKSSIASSLGLSAFVFLTLPLSAQTYLTSPAEPLQLAGFGASVAVAGQEIFVGESRNSYKPGVVYVYRTHSGEWGEHAQLTAADAVNGDGFGRSMAISGNVMIVGASTPADDPGGAVYVFEKNEDSGEWHQAARLTGSDIEDGDGFGVAVATNGSYAIVGAYSQDSTGAAYVFARAANGSWTEQAKLLPEDVATGDRFGVTISMKGGHAMIAATRQDSARGSVYVFGLDEESGAWQEQSKLDPADLEPDDRFGSTILLEDGFALIGSGRPNNRAGSVHSFELDGESGEWTESTTLVPFDASANLRFGTSVALGGNDVLVGAPGASGRTGTIYIMTWDPEAGYTSAVKLMSASASGGDFFAGQLAADGDLAVAALNGADFGAGKAAVLERNSTTGMWAEVAVLMSEEESLDPIAGGRIDCEDGWAAQFECSDVNLVSFIPVSELGGGRGVFLNDLWGWTDPDTGKEYAIVGRADGTSFVDLSDPLNPVYIGNLPRTAGANASAWRDMKVYANHAYITSDRAGDHGIQVFDLTQLRGLTSPVTFEETARYDLVSSAHNIVINEETGYAYAVGISAGGETCGGGLHMISLENPSAPTFAGCFSDPQTGRASTGYSHDAQCVIYRGPDAEHSGREICFSANETALSVADVTDKDNPVALARATYPNVGYTHQGWITEDHRYFFSNDELDELQGNAESTRTLVWDIEDLDDPILVREFWGETPAIDHNLYVRGDLLYQSNYKAGLRILDISDPENPREVAYFDTRPVGDNSPGFSGSWSNYPFFESGMIIVSSMNEGLFILQKSPELVP